MNKKSAQKSRQYCERPIDSVKLIPRKVRKSPMPRYYLVKWVTRGRWVFKNLKKWVTSFVLT